MKSTRGLSNQVRIIGGRWRGRKLLFPEIAGLRPTSDRIRETLFNWLMEHIVGARCCDLFAGSGALGFEALSRGATWVSFVEKDPTALSHLDHTARTFEAEGYELLQQEALQYLTQTSQVFDIIFLDPPFHQDYVARCLAVLQHASCVHSKTLIYVEAERGLQSSVEESSFTILKQKKAGNVYYHLLTPSDRTYNQTS